MTVTELIDRLRTAGPDEQVMDATGQVVRQVVVNAAGQVWLSTYPPITPETNPQPPGAP